MSKKAGVRKKSKKVSKRSSNDPLIPSSEEADVIAGTGEVRVGAFVGRSFAFKAVEFSIVDGRALVEGDIDLGKPDALTERLKTLHQSSSDDEAFAAVVSDRSRLWSEGRVPYVKPSDSTIAALVDDAVREINAKTKVRLFERAAETDHVVFEAAAYSSSPVGRQGGAQRIKLGPNATLGTAIHEVCHTLGIWHEQSREDRDTFVQVRWENIRAGYEHNFRQRITDGDDVGPYDFDSIMHYPASAFSRNDQPTLVPLVGAPHMGQRIALSPYDINAIHTLYPDSTVEAPRPSNASATDLAAAGFTRQFTTRLAPRSTGRLMTAGWPIDKSVDWHLVPTLPTSAAAPQISWSQQLSLSADGRLSYYFVIENFEPVEQIVDGWFRFSDVT